VKGVEWVTASSYARTVQLGKCKGWIRVTQAPEKRSLILEFAHSLAPALPALMNRVRDLFDLNVRPEVIVAHFATDKILGPLVAANPGARLPGAFNGFELGVRAILGQQVTVKAATTVAGRLAAAFGESIKTPFPELNRLTPSSRKLAVASVDELARLGLVSARCRSIIALARAQVSGELALDQWQPLQP
jgi:AraC family transcriptional regulator of adaptative response / DNA-3-methyladenine glycosylase II